MDLAIWISYAATVLLLVVTPGPSVLLATANSMKYGFKKTIGTILGDLTANLCQIILASAGLAAFVISSSKVFLIIKWCGVAYLVYIGFIKIISQPDINFKVEKTNYRAFSKLFAEGFLMSAANPKAIVFFAAFFPLFINESLPFLSQVIILAVTFLILDGCALLVYTLFVSRLKAILENRDKMYLQNRIVGLLLILSAIMLSLVNRTTK